jgi:hypothetical protein
MDDYNYFLVERLAEQQHAEILAAAEAERLARLVAGESGRAARRADRGRRLAYAACAPTG